MIQICFALHDADGSYAKFVATAMVSLLEHTKEAVSFHLLHDGTLTAINKDRLQAIAEQYGQNLRFYSVKLAVDFFVSSALAKYTAGAFFRLYLPELVAADRIIYLDADIVVKRDIKELWETDFAGFSCAACHDEPVQRGVWEHPLCRNGLFRVDSYFNSGVMLWNLKRIREEHDFVREGIDFFLRYPDSPCADQEFLNYVFRDDALLLEQGFDLFVGNRRADEISQIKAAIYHYSGEDGRPRFRNRDVFDEMWWGYFRRTPWGKGRELERFYEGKIAAAEKRQHWLENTLAILRRKRIIFWGAAGKIHDPLRCRLTDIVKEGDYYVDNNPALQGKIIASLPVRSPEALPAERCGTFVIVVVTLQYFAVRRLLLAQGYRENEDFINGRKLLAAEDGGYPTDCV